MKKGFTLIELLAVIIILAILMIIAVPNILSTLATARSSAFITQAESVYKAAEQQYIIDTMTGTASTCYDKNNLNLGSISSTVSFAVQINSSNGTVSSITINDSGQQLKASGTTMNNIALTTYSNETLSCSGSSNNNNNNNNQTPAQPTSAFGGTLVAAGANDTHKGIVYLNPKDLTATCTSTSELTTTNTGCKKFYIFDDSGTTYKMIMWKNTTATVAWNSSNSNSTPNQVATALASDTSGWQGSPRLITADEVAHIVGISNATTDTPPGTGWLSSKTYNSSPSDLSTQMTWFYFDGSGTTYSSTDGWQKRNLTNSKSAYKWLYDYTNGCTSNGCDNADSSTYGYWTSTAVSGSVKNVWLVRQLGYLDNLDASYSSYFGLRPVITISKSAIS